MQTFHHVIGTVFDLASAAFAILGNVPPAVYWSVVVVVIGLIAVIELIKHGHQKLYRATFLVAIAALLRNPLDLLPTEFSLGTYRKSIGVLYATNRKIEPPTVGAINLTQITDKRNQELTFGSAIVHVPDAHQAGMVERPTDWTIVGITFWHTKEDEKQDFIIRNLEIISKEDAIRVLEQSRDEGALIFVHGYRTSFEDAIFKTAQIVFDTHFSGVPIAFSWPSKNNLLGYDYDRESASYSWDSLLELLHLIKDDARISRVYIIAHSMGNQIVLDALARIPHAEPDFKLSEIIMAAPDVDRDLFIKRMQELKRVSNGLTLYASSSDKAMLASREKADGVRAGDIPSEGPVIVPGLDTIDVTALGDDIFALNHGTFSSSTSALGDIDRLLHAGTHPAGARSPELVAVPDYPPTKYWRYAK
jgi:esterase/lipase superfamily enzyme